MIPHKRYGDDVFYNFILENLSLVRSAALNSNPAILCQDCFATITVRLRGWHQLCPALTCISHVDTPATL